MCINPFSTLYYHTSFDGQTDPRQQHSKLVNSCCCSLQGNNVSAVRENIARGQKSKDCAICWSAEKTTGSSERVLSLIEATSDVVNKFLVTGDSDQIHVRIKFSNLCNLACRSCSPTFSSKYATVHQLTVPVELSQDISDDLLTWSNIQSQILNAIAAQKTISITLLGGESLIQPGVARLFKWIETNDLFSKINLSVTTNLTKLSPLYLEYFSKFNTVNLHCSIDSVYENYEYVRWPAKFDQVANNLLEIQKISNLNITIQPLWSLNNIFYINEFLDWCWQYCPTLPIKHVSMHRPDYLTVQNLPQRYRTQLIDTLNHAIAHCIFRNNSQTAFCYYLQGLLEHLHSAAAHDLFELYLFSTAQHDIANQTHMKHGNSKFYNLLTDHDKSMLEKFLNSHDINMLPENQKHHLLFNSPL